MALWLYLAIFYLYIAVISGFSCPKRCDCLGAIIDCSNKRLIELPANLPTWVEELDLSENPEIIVRNDSFSGLPNLKSLILRSLRLRQLPELYNLPHLKKLALSKNRLRSISPEWLQTMTSLEEIDLSKNDFELFDPSQFEHDTLRRIDLKSNRLRMVHSSLPFSLPSITELRLSRNRIGDEAFKNLSTAFSYMPSLKTLDLNRNSLERLQGLMFKDLVNISLTTLKLRRNNLVDLPDGAFYGLQSITTLHLDSNRNITMVSNGWLFGLESLRSLTLSHNNIGIIKENAWETTKLLSLLDVSYNQLGCRQREPVFKGLKNLQELFITHNCLSNFDSDTFANLSKLKILDISHNHLQWSVEDSTGAFRGLNNLVTLNLAFNRIETIHNNAFNSLTSLTTLDLSGNHLKTLSQNPFINMKHLSKLYFNTSSLVCDCRLVWLPKWLATQSFNAVKAFCAYPEEMDGISIFDLDPGNMKCNISPQPVITTSPSNQTVLYGQNVTLECIAYTGGDKVLFMWMKNREIQEPFRVKTFESVEETSEDGTPVYKVISHLNIPNVTHEHSGEYQCLARNSYGPDYSPHAKIEVHRFPYFTKVPKSVEVKEGKVAELNCAAAGYPIPEISWTKEGDEFLHAARERRLHYMDNVYYIQPIMPQDDGTYVCTAKNKAGSVSTSATVSVMQTPSFVNGPDLMQKANIGQTVILDCQGTGHPKPQVTWTKGGQKVIGDERRIMLEEGHFLLILKAESEDSGAYLCELINTIGVQRRKFIINVSGDSIMPATSILVMCVVLSILVTSIFWVCIIYRTRKKKIPRSPSDVGSRGGLNHVYSSHLSVNNLRTPHKGEQIHNLTPLLSAHHPMDPYSTHIGGGQDSGSEHSSGKDSGVGDSAHRSNEDLHRNGDVRNNRRRSLGYPEGSPNASKMKGQSNTANADSEDNRPKLSTFGGNQHLDPSRASGNSPIYASLRRGSTSRLLPVPSPVTPAGSLAGSLPRYSHRSHSNTGSIGRNRGLYTTGSSHTLPRSGTPPPTSLERDDDESKAFWKSVGYGGATSPNTAEKHNMSLNETAEQIYNYYSDPHSTFNSLTRNPKRRSSLKQATQDTQLLPSR